MARADVDPYFIKQEGDVSAHGPASITRNIIQDRNGDIWLATWQGILRYDGAQFTNFTNKDALRKYHVFSAMEDRDGGLWFGTIGAGVYRYDGTTFTNITKKNGLADEKQGCFLQTRNGDIWIGTMGGISIYNGSFYRNLTTENGLLDNDINSILEDRSGKIWIASRGELCTYDGEQFTAFRKDGAPLIPNLKNKNSERFFNVRTVIEDRNGNVWLAGQDGLWRYGDDGLTQFNDKFVGYVYEDRAGNIWTSSAGDVPSNWRLSRYAAEDLAKGAYSPTIVLEREDMFFGILEDKDGRIWLGSLNGVGRYDGETFAWFQEGR
jgi:ligand-binding sensor domain-containing protein